MNNYEKDIKEKIDNQEKLPDKLKISMIQYFWQANPLTGQRPDRIPRFLRHLEIFKNFTDNELRILSQSLHVRSFSHQEVIFAENHIGVGFYLIHSGQVDMLVESPSENQSRHLLTLEKGDYFGELALLQEKNIRNASAISRNGCILLGLFRPDLEDLIKTRPVIMTKFLQTISSIIADRLFLLSQEVKELNDKISQLEREKK